MTSSGKVGGGSMVGIDRRIECDGRNARKGDRGGTGVRRVRREGAGINEG